jgi:hypothetical protein
MAKPSLGPLPKVETVRLTVPLSSQVKAELDRYGEFYAQTYGEPAEAGALAAHMLATFMERDRAFRSWRSRPIETAPS